MRSARVSPGMLPTEASMLDHLTAAGVSSPEETVKNLASQEYDEWREIALLNPSSLKDLMEIVGLKHKSATKLAQYVVEFKRQYSEELRIPRPESAREPPTSVQHVDHEISSGRAREARDAGSLLNNSSASAAASAAAAAAAEPPVRGPLRSLPEHTEAAAQLAEEATALAQLHGDFGGAAVLFREALSLDAGSAAAWFGLGFSIYQRDGGQTIEQLECYERAVALDPSHVMARANLGNLLYLLRKDADGAEAQFRAALALDPGCADAHNHLGWLLEHARGDSAGAERCYAQAIALDPDYGDALVSLGALKAARKDGAGAEALFRRALELDPHNALASYNLGLVLSGRDGSADLAEEQYRRAVESSGGRSADALVSLGALLETVRKDPAGAELCYRQAIAADPNSANACNHLAILLEAITPPRLDEAEALYRRALELDPTHASAWYNLGLLLELLLNVDEAELCYRRTIEIDPGNANAHSNLGIILKDARRDYDGAEAMYRRALELDPSHSAACNNLGTLLETVRSDLPAAEALYRRALELDPTNGDAALNLGILLNGLAAGCEASDPARASALYCDAAAMWDASDGPGNAFSAEARLAASRLRASLNPSRPTTPMPTAGGGGGGGGGRPQSASRARRSPAEQRELSSRPVSRDGRPVSRDGRPVSRDGRRDEGQPRPLPFPSTLVGGDGGGGGGGAAFAASVRAEGDSAVQVAAANAPVAECAFVAAAAAPEYSLEAVFRAVDRNSDGGVTRGEILKTLNSKKAEAQWVHGALCRILGLPDKIDSKLAHEVFDLAFDCVDADGSGSVDLAELTRFVDDLRSISALYCQLRSPGGNRTAVGGGGSGGGGGGGGGGGVDDASGQRLDPAIAQLLAESDKDGDGNLSNAEIIRAIRRFPKIRELYHRTSGHKTHTRGPP